MVASGVIAKPVRAFGGFFSMALDTFVVMFKPPFAWREFISQSWFVARVSIIPTLMLTIPYTVLLTFTFNILLTEFGAADFSGTGAALGTVTQIGPIVTVLVIAGAGGAAHLPGMAAAMTPLPVFGVPVGGTRDNPARDTPHEAAAAARAHRDHRPARRTAAGRGRLGGLLLLGVWGARYPDRGHRARRLEPG